MKKTLLVLIFSLFSVNSYAATIISPIVATANVNTANYALDAANLASQPGSYYTNASNLDAGTVPSARLDTTYTNMTGITLTGTINATVLTDGTAKITGGVITGASNTNWDTAYTDRLKWDGGATGLTAATGRTSLGLGTIATQAESNVSISGGAIDGTPIGGSTPAAGAFTTLTATSGTINTLVAPTITSTTAINGVILTATTATINTLVAPTLTSTTGAITSLTSSGVSVNGTVTANWFAANDKVYAEMASSYNDTETVISLAGTYYTITANCFEVITKNATVSTSNGTITVLKTGKYWVIGRISGLSATLNDAIHFGISINGAKPLGYYESEFTITATSAKGGQTCGGIISLNANDTISTQIENVTDAHNITIKFYNLSLFRILD